MVGSSLALPEWERKPIWAFTKSLAFASRVLRRRLGTDNPRTILLVTGVDAIVLDAAQLLGLPREHADAPLHLLGSLAQRVPPQVSENAREGGCSGQVLVTEEPFGETNMPEPTEHEKIIQPSASRDVQVQSCLDAHAQRQLLGAADERPSLAPDRLHEEAVAALLMENTESPVMPASTTPEITILPSAFRDEQVQVCVDAHALRQLHGDADARPPHPLDRLHEDAGAAWLTENTRSPAEVSELSRMELTSVVLPEVENQVEANEILDFTDSDAAKTELLGKESECAESGTQITADPFAAVHQQIQEQKKLQHEMQILFTQQLALLQSTRHF